MITPWQRTLLRCVAGDCDSRGAVQRWTPSRYREVKGACVRRGYLDADGKLTQAGKEELAKMRAK